VPEAERAGLTTVRQPVREKGRAAGRLLLSRPEPTRSRTVSLPTELVIGTSSGSAGQTDAPFRHGGQLA